MCLCVNKKAQTDIAEIFFSNIVTLCKSSVYNRSWEIYSPINTPFFSEK
jgi:hypothetical protein